MLNDLSCFPSFNIEHSSLNISIFMILTDSHCHLTMSDADAVLARAREAGIRGFVVPGTKLDDAPEAVAVAQKHDDVWAAVGFHPHEAKDCDDAAFAEIERLAAQPRVAAHGGTRPGNTSGSASPGAASF